jgi:hypothetical protein
MSLPASVRVRCALRRAIGVGVFLLLTVPAAASATPVTLSLLNSRSYCVNRSGGHNTSGTTVFLYKCSGGNDNWIEINDPIDQQSPACGLTDCFEFEDPNAGKLCFGLSTSTQEGILTSCYNSWAVWNEGGTNGTLLHDTWWSGSGWLATPSNSNRSVLYETCEDCGTWHQWYGF